MSKKRRSPRAQERENRHPADPPRAADRALTAGVLVYVVTRFAASVFVEGPSRLWGIDFPRYLLGEADILCALLLPFTALIPLVRRVTGRALAHPLAPALFPRLYLPAAVFAAAVSAALTQMFPVGYAFLGDGAYYAGEMYRVISSPAYAPAFLKPTSWLAGETLRAVGTALRPADAGVPFALVGSTCAVLLTLALFAFLRRERKPIAILWCTAVVGSAGVLLFFGYIELYAMPYTFTVVYFLSAWAVFRFETPAWVPGVPLAFAVASGLPAVFFIPSYLFLLSFRIGTNRARITPVRTAVLLAALTAMVPVAGYALTGIDAPDGFLVPLVLGGNATHVRTLLSPDRLADIVNVLVLHGGPFVFALAALLVRPGRDGSFREPIVLFGLVACAGGMVFLLTGNAALGLARDWDLAAVPSFAFVFLAVALIGTAHERGTVSLPRVLPLLFLSALSASYAWVRLNVTTGSGSSAAAARLEDIVAADRASVLPVHTYTALENLRQYFHARGEDAKERALLEQMVGTRHLVLDTYDKLITTAGSVRDPVERRAVFEKVFAYLADEARGGVVDDGKRSLHELAARAVLAAAQGGEMGLARDALETFRRAFPAWKEAPLVEGFLEPDLPLAALAKRVSAAVDTSTRDAALLAAGARVLAREGDAQAAAVLYERAIEREPGRYPSLYLELARLAEEDLGDERLASRVLHACTRDARGTPEAAQAERMLHARGKRP